MMWHAHKLPVSVRHRTPNDLRPFLDPFEQTPNISRVSVEVTAGTDYRPTLLSLLENHASIIVLLAEGYDGRFVRSVLGQVGPHGAQSRLNR